MKVIAVNGSPRKNWNTHTLIEKCLEGAKEAGAETDMIFRIRAAPVALFDGAKRLKRRESVFVKDCEKAFLLGQKLVTIHT